MPAEQAGRLSDSEVEPVTDRQFSEKAFVSRNRAVMKAKDESMAAVAAEAVVREPRTEHNRFYRLSARHKRKRP